MPSTGQGVGKPVGHFKAQRLVNAVETLTFDGVVRGQAAQQYLYHKQGDRQEDVFAQCFLRRGQLDLEIGSSDGTSTSSCLVRKE